MLSDIQEKRETEGQIEVTDNEAESSATRRKSAITRRRSLLDAMETASNSGNSFISRSASVPPAPTQDIPASPVPPPPPPPPPPQSSAARPVPPPPPPPSPLSRTRSGSVKNVDHSPSSIPEEVVTPQAPLPPRPSLPADILGGIRNRNESDLRKIPEPKEKAMDPMASLLFSIKSGNKNLKSVPAEILTAKAAKPVEVSVIAIYLVIIFHSQINSKTKQLRPF